jgi:Arc/MetJ-type ribon-helix-helix transcriptional regulator
MEKKRPKPKANALPKSFGMPGWDVETLRAALIEGEESGIATKFDFDAFIKRKHAEAKRKKR